jgi:ParB family chromosome partitioning protein
MNPGRETTPKRLGRGLSALFGEAAAPATPAASAPPAGEGGTAMAAAQTVPIAALEPSPFQPRAAIDRERLDELVASIAANGVLQPLLVRPHPTLPGRYQIIAGERRWRAAQAVPLHEVPVLVRDLDDRTAAAASLVENLQRADLNPMEEAEGYRRLAETEGLDHAEIGRLIGRSRSHVANTLRLLNLPLVVQTHLREGRLTAGHARALLAARDPGMLADRVIREGLSVRLTEALAQQRALADRPRRRVSADPADPNTEALARDLSETLGLRVTIRFDGRRGEVRIAYDDLDQLDGLVALLQRAGG